MNIRFHCLGLIARPASLLALLSLISFPACSTSPRSLPTHGLAPDPAERINWPAEYEPAKATFFVHNKIDIKAPPTVVWDILVRAEAWPQWYVGAENLKVIDTATGRLSANAVFVWNTMGLRFESRIKEFVPPTRLSWESRKSTIQGYHAWLIVPTPEGCRVITDESQHGLLAVMQGIFIPNKLHRLHDIWLAELKKKAEALGAQP